MDNLRLELAQIFRDVIDELEAGWEDGQRSSEIDLWDLKTIFCEVAERLEKTTSKEISHEGL